MSLSTASSTVFNRTLHLLLALALALTLAACSTDSSVSNDDDSIPTDDPILDPVDPVSDVSAINFVSATPNVLALQGTAGDEQATIIFALRDENGQPVIDETVTFSIDNTTGGAFLTTTTADSDESGRVSVVLNSGSAPTVVTVTAAANGILENSNPVNIVDSDPVVTAINFVSATPQALALEGTAGDEQSTIIFALRGENGQPVIDETVTFSIDNATGGAFLTTTTAVSDESGSVSVVLNSGSAPTVVTVTAAAENGVLKNSNPVSISTGAAIPSAFSLAADLFNPRALNYNGTEVNITATAGDQAGNPVPEGTTINFRTNGGIVPPSCSTNLEGSCTVTWISSDPRADAGNGIATIFAHITGAEDYQDLNSDFRFVEGVDSTEEPFIDENDNGVWDEGETLVDWDGNGIQNNSDLAEPFADYNLDGDYDASVDDYIDFDNSGGATPTPGDGTWTGELAIGKSIRISMSGDAAYLGDTDPTDVDNDATEIDYLATTVGAITPPSPGELAAGIYGELVLDVGESAVLTAIIQDFNGNSVHSKILANQQTKIEWEYSGAGSLSIPDPEPIAPTRIAPNTQNVVFSAGTTAGTGLITLKVTFFDTGVYQFDWNLRVEDPTVP